MAVKKLSSDIQYLFSSSVHLFSYKRAIEELVYNALDAQSTSIAIRIHIQENKIQVIDNGCGIGKKDFVLLGQKYATSKFVDLSRYKSAPNSYGFRGQTLASLVGVSKYVKITARMTNTEETLMKTFYKGKAKATAQTTIRPSKGTTVEVNGFLYNLNIQNKGINPVNEINDIKTLLEQLSLVHNNVSFSLRDDSRNEIIFRAHKNSDIYQTFKCIFDLQKADIQELQVEKNEYKIVAYLAKNNDHHDRHRWIFLNKKFVNNAKLHKIIHDNLTKSVNLLCRMTKFKSKNVNNDEDLFKKTISFYFIFITCPYYDYVISNTPRQSTLEFKSWHQITTLVEKLVKFYTGELKVKEIQRTDKTENKNMLKNVNETDDTRQRVRDIMKKILGSNPKKGGVSQMQNGIKGKLIKRKKKKAPKLTISKVVPFKQPETTKYQNLSEHLLADNIKLNEHNNLLSKKAKPSYKTTKKGHHNKSKLQTTSRGNSNLLSKVKKIKKKKKHKNDVLVEIFRNPPEIVVEKCNLLAQEVENLLPCSNNIKQRVYINEAVNYSNIVKDNTNISIRKRVGEIIIHDYFPLKSKVKSHSIKYNNFGGFRKDNLITSSDLLRTIIGKEPANPQNSVSIGEFNDYQGRTQVQEEEKKKGPQLTYQSHHYISNGTSSHHYDINENIVEAHKKICQYQNKKGNLVLPPPSHNFNNNIPDTASPRRSKQKKLERNLNTRYEKNIQSKKLQIFEKSKLTTKHFNIRSFSNDFTSHTIEFSDSMEDKQENYRNNYSAIDVAETYKIPFTEVCPQSTRRVLTSTTGLTYTITSSLKSDFRNISQENNEYCGSDWISKLTYCKTEESFANKTNHPQTDQMNVIFISNSNDQTNVKSNSQIDPLNVCETILKSDNEIETRSKVNNTQCKHNDSLFNLTLWKLSSDEGHFEIIGDTQQLPQAPANQSNTLQRTIVNQEVNETSDENFIRDSIERVNNVEKIVQTNEQDKAIGNTEELGETLVAANFNIRNRLRFLPKGMSPLFENNCSKIKSDSKVESGYFADDLYNKFRDEVQNHSEAYEAHVKNPQDFVSKNIDKVNNRLDKDNSSLTFNAKSLKEAKVLGQIDNKFIASIIRGKSDQSDFLVLFDQHAVHERIRLEDNLADYFNNNEWKIAKLDDVLLKLSKDEILYLHNYKDKFTQLGLDWTILNNCSIKLHGLPAAIIGKNPRQVERVISAVKNLITEEINMIRSQKGCVSLYPKSIMDLVFSEACRYAIKFGDKLLKSECVELIQALSTCKTPFQCAHGRPVMAVIMDTKPETYSYQINVSEIRQLQQTWFKNKTKQWQS